MFLLCTANYLEQLETNYVKIRKEICDIDFVLSLMIKHGSTSVPTDERNNITDIDILILCEYNKELLQDLLFDKKIEKEISEIKFVLSLMIKHGSTSVPIEERKKISDVDILLLCKYNKQRLLKQLFDKERRLLASRRAMHTTASLGKLSYIISVSHYYFMILIYLPHYRVHTWCSSLCTSPVYL